MAEDRPEAELSGFELQAAITAAAHRSGRPLLDAGRGQPNWLAITPRAGAHVLGLFGLAEARAASREPLWGCEPERDGIAERLAQHLSGGTAGSAELADGAAFVGEAVRYGVDALGFEADAWVHELAVAALGSSYASPTRMLTHLEVVMQDYILHGLCAGVAPPGRFLVFGTEGGAAAMAYVFRSLKENHLVLPGQRIAIATPIFTPYLQIPTLEAFGFDVAVLPADLDSVNRFDDALLERLADPTIRAFFMVNPGNPDSRALPAERLARLGELVRTQRPDLIVVTDTVYATFVEGFRSIVTEIPHNVICVHSFSKNFGATGARLGFVAIHEDTAIDALLRGQPDDHRRAQQQRYRSLTADVSTVPFLGRMVADSREVALHNIAGLATPDQLQMALFALAFLVPSGQAYVARTRAELHARLDALLAPLGLDEPAGADSFYYALFDVSTVAAHRHGADFAAWLTGNVRPVTVPLRLAERHGVVVTPGTAFGAPAWDLRVSLASLDADQLATVGRAVVDVLDEFHATGPT